MTNLFISMKPWQKKTLIISASTLVIMCTIWTLIPSITKWAANKYLSEYEGKLTATEINPDLFPIGLSLKDVAITVKEQQTLSLNELSIGLDFWPLFTGAFDVNHIIIDGFSMDADQNESGWVIAGIPIAKNDKDTQTEEPKNSEAPQDNPIAPTFFIHNVSINNTSVRLNTLAGDDQLAITSLNISEVSHDTFNWRGVFDLEAKINDGTAKIEGDITANKEQLNASIDIGNIQLSSSDINHFLPQNIGYYSVSEVSLEGQTTATYHFNNSPKLSFSSPLITLDSQAFSFSDQDKKAAWQTLETEISDVSIDMNSASEINLNANTGLKFTGLELSYGDQSLQADNLAFSNNLEASKKGDSLEIKKGDSKLTLTKASAKSGGNQINLAEASASISSLLAKLSVPEATGDISGTIDISTNNLSGQLSDNSEADLEAFKMSAPVNVNLTKSSKTAVLKTFDLSLDNASFEKNDLNAQLASFGAQLANIALKQSDNGISVNSNRSDLAFKQANLTSKDITGSLDLLAINLSKTSVQQSDESLKVVSDTAVTSQSLNTTLRNLPNTQPETTLKYDTFDFKNQVSWQQSSDKSALNAKQNALNIDNVSVDQNDTMTSLLDTIKIKNDAVTVTLNQNQMTDLKADNSEIALGKLSAKLPDGGTLLSWKDFQVSSSQASFNKNGAVASLESISIKNLIASEPKLESGLPPLGKFEKLLVSNVDLRTQGVLIDSVKIDKLITGIALTESRNVANLILPNSVKSAKEDTEKNNNPVEDKATSGQKSIENKEPFYAVINTAEVSTDSQFSFSDQGITPTLSRVLDIEQLTVTNFNTRSQGEKAHILLKAKNGNYATIESDISIVPTADRLTMTAKAKIREVELPPISPYVSNALGYRINSGQLNMDLDLKSTEGELDGNTHIVLRQFDLGGEKSSNTVLKVGVIPLNLAVDTLKNRDDNIILDLPMSGDIANPTFQWQNFFLLPIRQGLFKASSSYLIQTFVPYANVISFVQFAGEQALKLRVEPLTFDYGSSDINSSQESFLDQLVKLMKDRDNAELRACGFGVPKDLDEETPPKNLSGDDQQALLQLANQRAESLKAYLVEADIKSSRIFLCSPSIDSSRKEQPRVELNF
ncbi:DUF748 domain-containing protein [Marinomonas atlantica]|uniref:DUF748 domain-containing protein n=1 Tax=Marinomonas atlantica TaxID=1806668 RepID=UPI0008356402|nr:DUF748 domain-containing protein [Marinomonas atlantica]MCO4786236.1 DUF748 domain-containing protein [Marinomonas atlantica]